MMKTTKFIALFAAMALASSAMADAANALLSFYTDGPDKYADGATVLDGEWYALVWSQDGNFEGITSECKAVDANDLVVIVAPLAKGGKCPFTVFQIDSKSACYKESGVYSVYLLDTRNAAKTAVAAKVNGKPASVDGAKLTENFGASSATAGTVDSKGVATAASWGESSVVIDGEAKQPTISAFAVAGAKVSITVDNLLPSVKYNVQMGKAPDKLETYGLEIPAAGVESANFEIDAGDAKFFKVVREPLSKEAK